MIVRGRERVFTQVNQWMNPGRPVPGSYYPPAYSISCILATSQDIVFSGKSYETCNPALSLTGDWTNQQWMGNTTNQRFHMWLDIPVAISKIYYENSHSSGAATNYGAKTFTFWGTNSYASFLDVTYADDAGWTQIPASQTTLDQHAAVDAPDPKYIYLSNRTQYMAYGFKFADGYGGGAAGMGVRRIVLQA
jgi:hypothetical protein